MYVNKAKEKIKNGLPALGYGLGEVSTNQVEIAGILGLDYILIDTEHSSLTPHLVEPLFIAAERRGIVPMVGIGNKCESEILKFLEAGAMGVLFPDVRNPEEVRQLLNYVKYAPEGERGMRSMRTADWALTASREEIHKMANEQIMFMIAIESEEAVSKVEEIVSMEGVDGVYFGPNDYSVTIGIPGQKNDPRVLEARKKVVAACKKYNKAFCGAALKADDIQKMYDAGATMITVSSTAIVAGACKQYKKAYDQVVDGITG